MSYASLDDLKKKFGQDELIALTDRVNQTTIDASIVTRALEDADAEINIYLLKRYQLPLSGTFPLLTILACDIARFRLHTTDPSDEVRKRYQDAKQMLEDIAHGTYDLNHPPTDTNEVKWQAHPRQLSGSQLSSF